MSEESPYQVLEKEYAKFIGTRGCVTTNTGTSALHLALEALEFPEGSEVIVPEFTMIASAWAVHYARLKPVFVDCDNDLLIDTTKIEKAITDKTKAIMITHIYGRVCNMDDVMVTAKKYGLRVIEDACEAQGANYSGRTVGSFDIGCFSFYRNKIICAEEGGAITTNDMELIRKAADMKSMAFGDEHNYLHGRMGFNYRMTDSQAKMALDSLSEVDSNLSIRKHIEHLYDELIPHEMKMTKRDVVWVYDIRLPDEQAKNRIVKTLNAKGFAARHSFKPMSMQPLFLGDYKKLNAYKQSLRVFYLPVNPLITELDVEKIVEIIKTV